MRTRGERNRRRGELAALAGLFLLGAGCSAHRGATRGAGPVPSSHELTPSTIGRDRSTVKPGQVIPPAGLGVDLVSAHAGSRSDA